VAKESVSHGLTLKKGKKPNNYRASKVETALVRAFSKETSKKANMLRGLQS